MNEKRDFPKKIAIEQIPNPTWGNPPIIGYKYDCDEVEDWFKRCIEDFPKWHYNGPYYWGSTRKILDSELVIEWFDKWFSPFRNKSDENV